MNIENKTIRNLITHWIERESLMEKRHTLGGKKVRSSGHHEFDPYIELQIAIIEQAMEDYVHASIVGDKKMTDEIRKFFKSDYGNIICGGNAEEAYETAKTLSHIAKEVLVSVKEPQKGIHYVTNIRVTEEFEKEFEKKNISVSKDKSGEFFVAKGVRNFMEILYILKKRECVRKQVEN